jgi:hypothetical protein
LPTWAKGVIAVGGALVGYLLVNKIIKDIKNKKSIKEQMESVKNASNELQNIVKSGTKPSYADSQYSSWSDSLQKAFAGCDWEQPLFPTGVNVGYTFGLTGWSGSGAKLANVVLKLKNDADFLKLITVYGVRTYDQCGFPPISGDFTGNLYSAVADELSDAEINALNKYLAKQKINYTF